MQVFGEILVDAEPEAIRAQLDDVEKLAAIDTETKQLTVLERRVGEELAEFVWRPFHVFPKFKAIFRYDHRRPDEISWEYLRGLPWFIRGWKLVYAWRQTSRGLTLTRRELYLHKVPVLGELALWLIWPIARWHLQSELRVIRAAAERSRAPAKA